jgi:hypothetical protein
MVMGQHSSARAGSRQRRGWRRVLITGISIGVGCATVAGVGLASGTPTPSVYSAIAPVTVLSKSLPAGTTTDVVVAGVGSVPSNATSVQLSVTALSGTTTSSMYVYPTGATQPTSANVRWLSGQTVTIPVTVAVGTAGKIRLTTDAGTVTIKVAVVGYFTAAPAPGSAGYATQANDINIADPSAGTTTVASLDVPAGTYEVQARADMNLNAGTSDAVGCSLIDPANGVINTTGVTLDTDISEVPVSMTGLDTTSGGAIKFVCTDIGSLSGAYDVELVAIQLSSATGDVTGG